MLKLEEIKKQAVVSGIDAVNPVRIVATELVGENALTVYYKTIEGAVLERMLFRTDESNLFLAESGKPWAFDSPGEDFKLAAEAFRINKCSAAKNGENSTSCLFCWRPRRDLNPCYRRERVLSLGNLLTIQATDGSLKAFLDTLGARYWT
jgi:hypothetical protein